ncbi:hypothetical protein V2J09_020844 [Rumex salicifolius]
MDSNIDAATTFPTESLLATGLDTSTEPSDHHHQEPSNPPPETTANSVEKRKRDDEEGEVDKSSAQHPFYKTSLCAFYRRQQKGECSHGETCRFAHSESELRPKPDGSWDPTSERGKKKMKLEREEKEAAEEEDELREADNAFMMPEALGEKDPKLSRCLIHLPRNWISDRLKEFLTEQSVVFQSATKRKGMSVGFLSFATEEQVESATEVLHGKLLNNRNLKVANTRWKKDHTKPSAAESVLGDGGDPSTSLIDGENGETIDETRLRAKSVRDVVTPLAYMPYPEQLEQKKNALMQTLKKLTRNVRKSCPNGVPLPEWILKSREIGALPCRLEGIVESPIINGYRNKCEFTPGYSADGKITVGFLLGNFKEGVTTVQEPIDCPNISEIACKYASIFQEFLQGSTLPVWNRFGNKGFWRQLTVREGRNPEKTNVSEVLLMVQVCSSDVDSAVVDDELKKMTLALSTGAASNSPPLPLTFLVVQDHTGISNVAHADAPLRQLSLSAENSDSAEGLANINALNESRIHDYISDLKFSISPTAFFQVNTMAAEKLYSLAGDWAGLGPDTLLFDICCGTGTIGLTLAHRVGLVVGIEMNSSAVSDAQRNAEINGIKNCRFVCSKAENVIDSLLKEYLKVTKEHDMTSYSPKVENKENIEENGKDTAADKETAQCDDDENPESETHKSDAAELVEKDLQNQHEKISTENGIQEKKQFSNVVVIVDPPRMGLHPVVTKTLRSHPSLCRLVYISCNPDTLVANAIELCTPSSENGDKKGHGNLGWRKMSNAGLARYRAKSMPNSEPFKPVKAMAVDMFPHTPHCELVMLLERCLSIYPGTDYPTGNNSVIVCTCAMNVGILSFY